jgi:2-oxoglutarate ferredoxin oxidoreductase subunit alpha
VYAEGMHRLLKKWDTAKTLVPKAEISSDNNSIGIIYYGTSAYAAKETEGLLKSQNIHIDKMCIKAFPFGTEVESFIQSHKTLFVIEQNRDAQIKSLLVNELQVDPHKLNEVLNIDGMPITAQFIVSEMLKVLV